jgi:hypothetical protein
LADWSDHFRRGGQLRRGWLDIICQGATGFTCACHRPQGQGLHYREGWVDSFADCFHRFKEITRQQGEKFQLFFRAVTGAAESAVQSLLEFKL